MIVISEDVVKLAIVSKESRKKQIKENGIWIDAIPEQREDWFELVFKVGLNLDKKLVFNVKGSQTEQYLKLEGKTGVLQLDITQFGREGAKAKFYAFIPQK